MAVIQNDNNGKFTRQHQIWSLQNFDDGYIDSRGRFRVYSPNRPRAYSEGYVLRAIVAYEAYTGDAVASNYDVHHKNKDKLDDSRDSIEKKLHSKHAGEHALRPDSWENRIYISCGSVFLLEKWRLNQPNHVGKYCSITCYHKHRYATVKSRDKK
jgi:hypothetical protein